MSEHLITMGWSTLFALVAGIVGIFLVVCAAGFVPRLLERFTPNLDEEKEIARGNRAVADYFGRVVAACIIGISIVIAAAILGGFM
jgi:ABC-type multidrug transport system fused ATPase/permease subunit